MRSELKSSIDGDKQTINDLWHGRMGHAYRTAVEDMIKKPSYGLSESKQLERLSCETFVQMKESKQPAIGNLVKHSRTMKIHKDICGPFKEKWFAVNYYL